MIHRFFTILVISIMIVLLTFGTTRQIYSLEEASISTMSSEDFIDLQEMIPNVVIDIKYSTPDNFTQTKLYDSSRALLRRGTAEKLKKVAEEVAQKGYRIKVWDAYRPPEAQFKMWKLKPDSRYIANPNQGYSNHSRGSAVDLTLVDMQGNEVPMPTGYDEFTSAAARSYLNSEAKYLEDVMKKYGFKPLATEWWHYDDQDRYRPAHSPEVSVSVLNKNQELSFTISAIGDVTLGQDSRFPYQGSFNQYYEQNGVDYFFSGVQSILNQDDLTIANLEGTFTEAEEKPDKSFQGNQAFYFKGKPGYTTILENGSIEAVNIANNHSMDFYEKGLTDTLLGLYEARITSFGYNSIALYERKGIKVGLIGVNLLGPLEMGVDLAKIKADLAENLKKLEPKTSLTIVSFHWGTENKKNPDSVQYELGRFAVEQGADLVLGHHPHIIQSYEIYQGKTIVYSLGNFVFGGNSNPRFKETIIFQQNFNFAKDILISIDSPKVIPCKLITPFRPVPIP